MENSILTDIKKLLGIEEDYTHFDPDIVMNINGAMMVLAQAGVGPIDGFSISDETTTWGEYITRKDLDMVKIWIYNRVRLSFDPPQNSFLVKAINDQLTEDLWRLNVRAETP